MDNPKFISAVFDISNKKIKVIFEAEGIHKLINVEWKNEVDPKKIPNNWLSLALSELNMQLDKERQIKMGRRLITDY